MNPADEAPIPSSTQLELAGLLDQLMDQDALRSAGEMGHSFAVLGDGPGGVRRVLGEADDLDYARRMARAEEACRPVIYRRNGRWWKRAA